jgi:DNA repair protein RadA/Sms
VKEAARLGFKRCILPKQNQEKMKTIKDVELAGVKAVREAIDVVFK